MFTLSKGLVVLVNVLNKTDVRKVSYFLYVPPLLATQTPSPVTLIYFGTMVVYEQDIKVLVTLYSETEVGKVSYILNVPPVLSSPLSVTLVDFGTMVYVQGVEVLITLSSEIEVGKVDYILYVPHVLSLLQHNHHYQ